MNGFVEQKIKKLSGGSIPVMILLWICCLLFLAFPALIIGMASTSQKAIPRDELLIAIALTACALGFAFLAIKQAAQRSKAKKNPYAMITLFGCNDSPKTVVEKFNEECRKKINFEYANYFYATDSFFLADRRMSIDIAKISSIICVYGGASTSTNKTSVQGKPLRTSTTMYIFHLYFAGNKEPMNLTAMKQKDIPLLTSMLQGYGLVVETDVNLYKLASNDYHEFELECARRKTVSE